MPTFLIRREKREETHTLLMVLIPKEIRKQVNTLEEISKKKKLRMNMTMKRATTVKKMPA